MQLLHRQSAQQTKPNGHQIFSAPGGRLQIRVAGLAAGSVAKVVYQDPAGAWISCGPKHEYTGGTGNEDNAFIALLTLGQGTQFGAILSNANAGDNVNVTASEAT